MIITEWKRRRSQARRGRADAEGAGWPMGRDSLSGDEKKSGFSYMGKESQKVSKGSSGKVIF